MPLDDDRLRRQPPLRAGPRRTRLSDAAETGGTAARPSPASPPSQLMPVAPGVAEVVAAAYGVLDDNVDQGRRAAERFRSAAPPPAGPAPNAKAVAGRLLQVTREMGVAWVDLAVALLREPEVKAIFDRLTLQDRPQGHAAEPLRGAPSVTQRIASRKPLEVTLSPLAWSGGQPPAIGGLHALDPATPPIRAVLFSLRPDGGLEMRIDIPDGQPTGAYFGTVVGAIGLDPIGTLAVRVLD
jgi:hypothetical protein